MKQTQKTSNYWSLSSSFPIGAAVLLAFRWETSLVKEWGYVPLSSKGMLIGFSLWMGILLLAILADFGLYRAGVNGPARSGIWFAALVGPYAGMVALNEWGHLVGSQVIGVISTLLAFWLGYWAEQRQMRKNVVKSGSTGR